MQVRVLPESYASIALVERSRKDHLERSRGSFPHAVRFRLSGFIQLPAPPEEFIE